MIEKNKNSLDELVNMIENFKENLFVCSEKGEQFTDMDLKDIEKLINSFKRWSHYLPFLSFYYKKKLVKLLKEKGIKIALENYRNITHKELFQIMNKILQETRDFIKAKSDKEKTFYELENNKKIKIHIIEQIKELESEVYMKKELYKDYSNRLILRLKEWHYWNLQKNNIFKDKLQGFIMGQNPWKDNLYNYIIQYSPILISTALSVRNIFPMKENIFQTAIVDEGSQTLWCYIIPIYYRAKKLCVISDEFQLEPVVEKTKNDYLDQIFSDFPCYLNFKSSAINTLKNIDQTPPNYRRLKEHFRCQAPIIKFCNDLIEYGLTIKTEFKSYNFLNKPNEEIWTIFKNPFFFKSIEGREVAEGSSWLNVEEAEWITNFISSIEGLVKIEDIAILTPYRAQSLYLKRKLSRFKNEITIGTIHKLQGDEKEIIVLSIVRTSANALENSPLFKKENINVAVSRAKKHLILVGKANAIEMISDKENALYKLYKYIKHFEKNNQQYYTI